MALPLNEAKEIARQINEAFGGWGWKAWVQGGQNEVLVQSEEDDGRFGFAGRLKEFAEIAKGWSFSVLIYNEKITLVIW